MAPQTVTHPGFSDRLRITTCQAYNTHAPTQAVAAYLAERVGINVELILDRPWPEQKNRLLDGDIHLGWVCGLWYAQQTAELKPPLRLLAAPVFRGRRYQNRPVYFSDVVVRRESGMNRFADLAGSTWVFNEPNSLSGHLAMRRALADRGRTPAFFGRVIASGGHLQSLAMVAAGEADVAAIDSTIWDDVQQNRPGMCRRLRVMQVLGPNPAPPWVISRRVPAEIGRQIRQALLEMHHRPAGRALLKETILAHFTRADRRDYASLLVH